MKNNSLVKVGSTSPRVRAHWILVDGYDYLGVAVNLKGRFFI